jgi:hypothetical protein
MKKCQQRPQFSAAVPRMMAALRLLAGALVAALGQGVGVPLFIPGNASGADCIGSRCFICWRIPALAGPSPSSGRLFAFAEARDVAGCDDHGAPGAVVLAVKSSDDGGGSWSKPRQVARVDAAPGPYGRATGNPAPLVFESHIELVFSVNNLEAWSVTSTDDGAAFSAPKNRTAAMKPNLPHRNWWASGPPGGIMLPSGRAILCANIEEPVGHPWSFAVYSDDNGTTWQTGYDQAAGKWKEGSRVSLFGGSGECQVARFGVNGAHLAMLVRSEVNMSGYTSTPPVSLISESFPTDCLRFRHADHAFAAQPRDRHVHGQWCDLARIQAAPGTPRGQLPGQHRWGTAARRLRRPVVARRHGADQHLHVTSQAIRRCWDF